MASASPVSGQTALFLFTAEFQESEREDQASAAGSTFDYSKGGQSVVPMVGAGELKNKLKELNSRVSFSYLNTGREKFMELNTKLSLKAPDESLDGVVSVTVETINVSALKTFRCTIGQENTDFDGMKIREKIENHPKGTSAVVDVVYNDASRTFNYSVLSIPEGQASQQAASGWLTRAIRSAYDALPK